MESEGVLGSHNAEKFTTISWHSNFLTVLYSRKELETEQVVPIVEETCSQANPCDHKQTWNDPSPACALSRAHKPSLREPLQLTVKSRDLTALPHCQWARTTPWAFPKQRGKKDADVPSLALACTSYSLMVPFQVQPLLMQTAGRLSTSRRAALSGKAWNGKNKQTTNITEGLQFWSGLWILSENSSQTSCPINPQRCANSNQIAVTALSRAPLHTRDLDFSTGESNTVITLLTTEEKGS